MADLVYPSGDGDQKRACVIYLFRSLCPGSNVLSSLYRVRVDLTRRAQIAMYKRLISDRLALGTLNPLKI